MLSVYLRVCLSACLCVCVDECCLAVAGCVVDPRAQHFSIEADNHLAHLRCGRNGQRAGQMAELL